MRTPRFAGLMGLGAAVIGTLAVPAAAKVIVFDNSDGTFQWIPLSEGVDGANWLDITQPPTQVLTELDGNNRFTKVVPFSASSCTIPIMKHYYDAQSGASIAVSNAPIEVSFIGVCSPWTVSSIPPVPYAPTQPIDADAVWSDKGVHSVNFPGFIILLPFTMGVSITLPDGVHYGWIRIGTGVIDGVDQSNQPLAWAYETEPGVAIPAWGVPDADGVLHVPSEHPNIRGALNDALPGQTVLVADGVYTGWGNRLLDFHGKKLTLRSENGPANCIIDGEGENRGIHFHNGEGPHALVDGFTIMNCVTHSGESTPSGTVGGGAGICCELGSSPTIRNCIVRSNTCPATGAGIRLQSSSATIANCVIHDNSSISLPGIGAYGGAPTIANCTITSNTATSGESAIGSDSAIFTNCIVWENSSSSFSPSTTASVTYSCVEGGWPGVGNFSSDPQFVNPALADYHLAAGSPCIDAASNPAVPHGVTEDLDGHRRFVDDPGTLDTGLGRAPIVDMGAYEFQLPFGPADLNEDGDVDGFDLAMLLGAWTGAASYAPCPPHAPADLNVDCKVNGLDLAILLGEWG